MKEVFTSKILRKVLVLAFLSVGLVFALSSNKTTEPAQASQCCQDCHGGGDPTLAADFRNNYCNGSESCLDNCRNQTNLCYAHCTWCIDNAEPDTSRVVCQSTRGCDTCSTPNGNWGDLSSPAYTETRHRNTRTLSGHLNTPDGSRGMPSDSTYHAPGLRGCCFR